MANHSQILTERAPPYPYRESQRDEQCKSRLFRYLDDVNGRAVAYCVGQILARPSATGRRPDCGLVCQSADGSHRPAEADPERKKALVAGLARAPKPIAADSRLEKLLRRLSFLGPMHTCLARQRLAHTWQT
jgi:hypothetical protein